MKASVNTPWRVLEWMQFSKQVQEHISQYTVPQYGDKPDDQVEAWSAEDCVKAIAKYCARFGSNARGPEERARDLLKVAHYACLAHAKMTGSEG